MVIRKEVEQERNNRNTRRYSIPANIAAGRRHPDSPAAGVCGMGSDVSMGFVKGIPFFQS
jgi:hypothetical protein